MGMINVDIWDDERFQKLTTTARLIFIGMVSQADDDNVFDPDPKVIRARMHYCGSIIPPDQFAADVQSIFAVGLAIPHLVDGTPRGAKLVQE